MHKISGLLAATLAVGLGGAAAGDAPIPAGWKTYANHPLGYSISHPADWRVDVNYVYPGFGPDFPIKGVAFEIPESMTAGTNLAMNLTNVSVESRNKPGACDARRFIPDPADMHDVTQFDRTWSVATQEDAGAGNFYEITVFVAKDTSPCIAVRYFIHSMNIENYDPGAVKPFNRAALIKTFDRIRSTLVTGPH